MVRPDVPYDSEHPHFDDLSEDDKELLLGLNEKVAKGVSPLSSGERIVLDKLHDMMDDPAPINEDHPGWLDLTPEEQALLKDLLAKAESGARLTPEEQALLDKLADVVKNGRSLDENHPGWQNLTPEQQDELKKLHDKLASGLSLTPEEVKKLHELEDLIRGDAPGDGSSDKTLGAEKLSTQDEEEEAKALQALPGTAKLQMAEKPKLRDDPKSKTGHEPLEVGKDHPGYANLSPKQQKELDAILKKIANG